MIYTLLGSPTLYHDFHGFDILLCRAYRCSFSTSSQLSLLLMLRGMLFPLYKTDTLLFPSGIWLKRLPCRLPRWVSRRSRYRIAPRTVFVAVKVSHLGGMAVGCAGGVGKVD